MRLQGNLEPVAARRVVRVPQEIRHLGCPTRAPTPIDNIGENRGLTNRSEPLENENPGALAGATGAWEWSDREEALDTNSTITACLRATPFYWDRRSNSVERVDPLREVLA